eukprot:tig00021687_g23129.t2
MAMGPRRVGVSRESNCYRGTHVKLVLGTVATALVRKRDAPELYSEVNPNGLCVLCGTRQQDIAGRPRLVAGTEETLEHMLTCLSAVAVEARAAAEASISAVVSGALAKPLQRSLPQALCNSLKVTRVNEPTLTPLERRTQICVLRGLPPAGLTDMVRETIPDEKLAAEVTRKLTTAIGEQAHKTWAARCKAYAEWEKAHAAAPGAGAGSSSAASDWLALPPPPAIPTAQPAGGASADASASAGSSSSSAPAGPAPFLDGASIAAALGPALSQMAVGAVQAAMQGLQPLTGSISTAIGTINSNLNVLASNQSTTELESKEHRDPAPKEGAMAAYTTSKAIDALLGSFNLNTLFLDFRSSAAEQLTKARKVREGFLPVSILNKTNDLAMKDLFRTIGSSSAWHMAFAAADVAVEIQGAAQFQLLISLQSAQRLRKTGDEAAANASAACALHIYRAIEAATKVLFALGGGNPIYTPHQSPPDT